MFNFKTLECNYCGSVINNLPEAEVKKMDGLTFICECCNHSNILMGSKLQKCHTGDATSIFTLISENIPA